MKLLELKKENNKRILRFLGIKISWKKKKCCSEISSQKKFYYKNRENCKQRAIKVVFLISFTDMWESVKFVYNEMLQDECFEPIIISIPRKTKNGNLEYNQMNYDFFNNQGIQVTSGYDEATKQWIDLRSMRPDVVFIQTPYCELDTIENYNEIFDYAHIAYIPYGATIAKIQHEQFNHPFHNKCWKIFVETPMHKKMFKKYSKIDNRNILSLGNPKFDIFNKMSENIDENKYWKISKNKNPMIKRILWTPHWSVGNYLNYSNFLEYYQYFLNLAKNNSNIEIILKPHPELYEQLLKIGKMSKEDIKNMEFEFNSLPNTSIYKGGDYFELFLTSDAMINDSSSFLVEYLPTKKPLLFLDSQKHIGFNEFGEKLVENHYISKSFEQTDHFIQNVLIDGNDYMLKKRMAAMKTLLHMPKEGAGYLIKENIKKSFITQKKLPEQTISKNYWENSQAYSYEDAFAARANKQKDFAAKHFIPLLDKNSTLLDIGSADGWFDFYLSPFVKNIEAYDISEHYIDAAIKRANELNINNVSFKKGNVVNLTRTKKFDNITVLGVTLYIIEDDIFENFINKLADCIKQEGILLTKDLFSLEPDSFTYKNNNYVCRYRTVDYYVNAFKEKGFELVVSEFMDEDGNFHNKKAEMRLFMFKKINPSKLTKEVK